MKYVENNKTIEKELEEKVKCKELSNEQWQEMVCDLLKIIPENKFTRVNYLINKDELQEKLTFEEISEIIDGVISDAEKGLYCDESYFDYSLDEEVVIGDESWIDEIDRAFRGIKGLFDEKKYNEVVDLYEKIFNITERNYEELHSLLPNYYHVEDMLECKIQEHYLNYLNAIYYVLDENKIEKFVKAFKEHRYNLDAYVIHEFSKKHEKFRNEMIIPIVNKLTECDKWFSYKIVFQLLIEKNGTDEVFKFLQKNSMDNMRIFELLCEFMMNKFEYNELLEYLFALEKINMKDRQKELIYKKIIDLCDIMKDDELKRKYLYKINDLHPKLTYTVQICENLSVDDQIKEISKLSDKFIVVKEKNEWEKILIDLILGKIENVYVIFEKLDNYYKEHVENLIFYYLLFFGSRKNNEKKLIREKFVEEIKNIENNIDTDLIFKIMQATKKEIPEELIKKVEKQFENKISKITKKYLKTQQRGRYQEVADYLIAFVEYLSQEGRVNEGKILLQKFQEEYTHYNVYKKCLKNSLERSSVGE